MWIRGTAVWIFTTDYTDYTMELMLSPEALVERQTTSFAQHFLSPAKEDQCYRCARFVSLMDSCLRRND